MATNIHNEYFNPTKQVDKMLIPKEDQVRIVSDWNDHVSFFRKNGGNMPVPAISHAYLPPGWNKNDGAYLSLLPIQQIVAGEFDQTWWFGDPLWDDGTGKGNGFFWAPVVETPENDVQPISTPSAAQVSPKPSKAPVAPSVASQTTSTVKKEKASMLDNLKEKYNALDAKTQKKVLIGAAVIGIILFVIITG